MKKLLMFLFLMTISLGQSQSLKLGFEAGESGNANGPFGGFVIQPVEAGTGSNTSMVLPIIANPTGQPWQGCNFVLTSPVELIATKTMTIDVLSSQPVTFLMKVNGGVAGAPEAAAEASHNGDGTWQTISFTFNTSLDGKAAQANGVYNNMVLHPFFPFTGASERTFYIDNISGPMVSPTLSNFSVPAKLVGDAAFELSAPTTNSAGAFTYTSSNTGVATISGTTVTVVGAGTSTITATQAANGSYGAGSITAALVVTSAPIPTIGALTLPTNKVTGDAPFNLTDPSSNSAGAFTYTSSNTAVATISGSTVTIVGIGSSTITATQDATESYATGSVSATLNVGAPLSQLYGFEVGETGNVFGNFGGMPLPTIVDGTGTNTSKVLSIVSNPTGEVWQGFNYVLTSAVDLTATKTMTVDVLSSTPITFLLKVNTGTGPEAAAQASHNGDGTWQTISFTFNTSLDGKAAQANGVYPNMVIHPFFPFAQGNRTFYIDNVQGPLATVAPIISNFSIPAKLAGDAPFELTAPTTNSAGAFTYTSSNESVATISGSTVTVVGVGTSTITANQAASGSKTAGSITATLTVTSVPVPTIGALTVPTKMVGDAPFVLTDPSSNSAGAFTYTSSNTAIATVSGSTVTILAAGTSTITATQAATESYATGSVSATLTVTPPAPTEAAPTPTKASEDVLSIFSNAYTNLIGTAFAPNWGQNPTYSLVQIAGNDTNRYLNFSFVGNTFGAGGVNASTMEQLHLDIWTPDCTSFDVYILDGTAPEQKFTLTPTTSQWNSFDIDLAQYTSLTKSGIIEFKFERSDVGLKSIYLDNIYFWKAPSGTLNYYVDADGDGYGAGTVTVSATPIEGSVTNNTDCDDNNVAINPGATEILDGIDNNCDGSIDEGFPPATDAPTPITNPWDVKSVYSSAYTNFAGVNFFPNWGQTTTFTNFTPVSDETLKYSNLTYQGIDFNGGKDVSDMTTLHLDVFSRDISSINVALIAGGENSVIIPLTAGWNSINLDLATQYAGRNLTNAIQLKLERTLWTPTDGNVNSLYVDNIYFYRAATSLPAPVVTNSSRCKVTVGVAPTAVAQPGYSLVWYSSATTTTPLAAEPLITSSSRTVWVAQRLGTTGPISPRAQVTTTVNPSPTEVLGALTSTTEETLGTFAPATLKAGQYVGTTTEISYRIPTFTGANLTYLWNVPAGVTIVGASNTNVLTVHYNNVASGIGTIGEITVQAVNSNGCAGTAKKVIVSKVLPTAPGSIKMTNAALPLPVSGVAAAITTFAPYMGTTTELTLTAKPSTTATSYDWELPTGVTQISGENSNVITVNFAGVTSGNTDNYSTTAAVPVSTNVTRIGVKARNGVGVSVTPNTALLDPTTTSTARLLTLKATLPAAPASLKMFNTAASTTVAVTDISKFIGTSTELTLTAAVSKLASSYSWEIPSNVTVVAGSDLNSNSIKVTFANVPAATASLYLGVKAVNGIGSSVTVNAATLVPATTSTARLLKVTAKAPATPGTVVGSLKICGTIATSQTYSVTLAAAGANTYNITAPEGCTVTGGTGNTATIAATADATFTVNYPASFIATTTVIKTITIQSVNGFGVSATNKVLKLTNTGATCTPRLSGSSANDFSVIAYPNPSSSEFTIESSAKGAMSVKVYDMQGRLVEKAETNRVGSRLAKGVYNVIVNQGANTKSVRVIKN